MHNKVLAKKGGQLAVMNHLKSTHTFVQVLG
jgi:hypothetical protein